MRGAKYIKMAESRVDSANRTKIAESALDSAIWLNAIKVAIINKNEAQAMNLVENLPVFENINDLQSARELILQVGAWLEAEKKALAIKMEKLKSQKRFLG